MNRFQILWRTLKEINFVAIREEAEVPPRILIVGGPAETRERMMLSFYEGPKANTVPPWQAVTSHPLPCNEACKGTATSADAILWLHPTGEQGDPYLDALRRQGKLILDAVIADEQSLVPGLLRWNEAVPDRFFGQVGKVLASRIPERQVALARAFPALRPSLLKGLVESVSWQNAVYVLASGMGEMIPVFNLSVDIADMVVLTKNQAIMAYRIALGMGEYGDAKEVLPTLMSVVGGGFFWRQIARQLVGLIPGWGVAPQVAVAYAGTYATGIAIYQWYATGRKLSPKELGGLYRQAFSRVREMLKKKERTRLPAVPGK